MIKIVRQIKQIFLDPKVKKDYKELKWEKIQYEKISEILVETHNFSKTRVENALDRLKKLDDSSQQVSLDKFMGSK